MNEGTAAAHGVPLPTPGAPEKAAIRSMFDRIAPRYDLLNRLLSAGIDARWRRACVELLEFGAGGRVLDLCTGTADLLIEALRRSPEAGGIGVDLSSAMLLRGRAKLGRGGLAARAGLASGDAERLPLRDDVFDGALVAFGIRNVGDPEAAVREVLRVLKPGGRFVVLEFSMPAGLLGSAYRFYFGRLLPWIGGLVSGDRGAYAYLPASVERFPSPTAFAAMLERAGFVSLRRRALTGGIAYLYRGDKAA
jgi:demethylmenaquinone methyltransferase / 2-methoxy-6-polyprenyl-1,4-benzoquinol methylase